MGLFLRQRKGGKNKKRNSYRLPHYFSIITGFGLFMVTAFFLSPLIHEHSHMSFLDFCGCEYSYYSGPGSIEVTPHCVLNSTEALLFMASGIGSTAILSIISFGFFCFLKRKEISGLANIFVFLVLGFASDFWLYLFSGSGDIYAIFAITGFSHLIEITPYIGASATIAFGIFAHRKIDFGFTADKIIAGSLLEPIE